MVLWHSLDAWTRPSDRTGLTWATIVLLGGWAAPLFLFLAGVSVALAGSSRLKKGIPRRDVGWRLQKRGWQIFGLAHLFRLQSFLLTPTASWSSLLKPDILNILGLGLAAGAFCWTRATTRWRQIVWLLAPAAAIVLTTPFSRQWLWPEWFRPHLPRLEAYIRPVQGQGVFSVFPWVAFVFVGAAIGSFIAASPSTAPESTQRRLALVGGSLCLAGAIGAFLPSLTPSAFWTTSASFFLLRVGMMTLAFPLVWLWLRGRRVDGVAPMLAFGRASLFVYWVHVEMVYGVPSAGWHTRLPLGWALVAFVTFTATLVGAAKLWIAWDGPIVPDSLKIDTRRDFSARVRLVS
jgi:uncharacterized membrane protein